MCDRAKNPKLFNRLLKPHWDSNLRSTYGVLTDLGPSGLLFICPCQRQSMSISSDFVAILKLSIANLRPHWHPLPPMEWHHFEAKTSIKFSKVSSRRPKILKLWTLWTLWTALTVTYSDLQWLTVYSDDLPPSFPKPRNMVCRSGARPNHAASPHDSSISTRLGRWRNELKISEDQQRICQCGSPNKSENALDIPRCL